jgi:excisionase family DNA binding protein
MMDTPSELTVREVAVELQCTLKFVYDLLWAGRLEGAQKVGRTWRIPVEAVEARMRPNQNRNENGVQSRASSFRRRGA